MKLTFYNRPGRRTLIRPGLAQRSWMDRTFESFAYRCLPLTIANSHGWEILSPCSFTAVWNGSQEQNGLQIFSQDPMYDLPASHFGHGILTFYTHGVFRTEPGYDLWVGGPPNTPRDGVIPLSGIVETDWLDASFTMNWLFTRSNCAVTFNKGDPFCFVFPIKRGLLETIEPDTRDMSESPELKKNFESWGQSRDQHNVDKQRPGSSAAKERWQKDYYRGRNPDSPGQVKDHKIKLRLKPFYDN